MGKKELAGRNIWQDVGGKKAGFAEKNFLSVMETALHGTPLIVRSKPKEFKNIYSGIQLPEHISQSIYNPDETWTHRVIPDFAIENTENQKTLYVEVKRQDGWVEGKERKAGRGNAHERSCKFFTPGLLATLRDKGRLGDSILPFWVVFQGDIARDPKRVREIYHWYHGYHDHIFLWGGTTDDQLLVDHFNMKLRRFLV
jgi:Type II restriction enzyme MunI